MHIDHDHVSGGHHHHDHDHHHDHHHDHCHSDCGSCQSKCEHSPMEELMALMQYMVTHNAAHARELAQLAEQFRTAGNPAAYEQVLAAVSDFALSRSGTSSPPRGRSRRRTRCRSTSGSGGTPCGACA